MNMKNVTLLLSLLLCIPALSLAQKEKVVESKIDKVTVFMTGAQVNRKADLVLEKGRTTLVFKELSHLIDPSTIHLTTGPVVSVLSIKHRLEYLGDTKADPKVKPIKDSIMYLNTLMEHVVVKNQILKQKENYLVQNRKMETGSQHFDPQRFKELNEYYNGQFTGILNERQMLQNRYEKLLKSKYKFLNELRALENPRTEETSTIEVLVDAGEKATVDLKLKYSVAGAGWTPSYDIRVNKLDQPLEVAFKANVAQNTGEDWENVNLVFSNGDPSRNNTVPDITPYYLSYVDPTHYRIRSNAMYEDAKQNMSLIEEKVITGKVLDSETGLALPYARVNTSGGLVAITDENGEFTTEIPQGISSVTVNYVGYNSTNANLVNGLNIIYMKSNALATYKQTLSQETSLNAATNAQRYEWSFSDSVMGLEDMDNVANYFRDGSLAVSVNRYKASRGLGLFDANRMVAPLASPIENNISISFEMKEKYTIKSNGKPEILEMNTISIPATFEYYTVPKIEQSAFLVARVVDWTKYNLLPGETNLYLENTYIGKSELDVYYISDTLDISLGRDPGVTVKREKVKEFSGRQFLGSDNIDKRQFRIRIMNSKSTPINVVVIDQVPISQSKDITVEVGTVSGAKHNTETGEVKKILTVKPGAIEEMDIRYTVKYPKGRMVNLE